MRILIAGASGAIGRPLVRRLRANQHEVCALTRSPDSAPPLKEIGAEPVIADALDAAAVKAAVGRIRPHGPSRSSPARPRESRPAPAPTWNWKRAHRRPRESSSSRYVTDSSTAPAPGICARAILVIRCGNSRFRLSVRARASTASCIALPRWSARRERTTSSTETRRLSTWLTAFARVAGAPAPPRVSEEEALRASGPDAVRRWWINVASAVSLMRARKKSGDLTTAIVPAGTSFPARAGTL